MQWSDPDILGEVFESRLCLSKSEYATLRKASTILYKIRKELEDNYGGEDGVLDVPVASDWVYAECFFSEAMGGQDIVLWPRESTQKGR